MSLPEDLLKPTLGGAASGGARLHSAATGYLASFFGGPVAGAIVALANSRRLGRMRQDWPLLPGALLVEGLLQMWLLRGGARLMEAALGQVGPVLMNRVVGLLFFGAIYLLHKRYYRGARVMGLGAANGILIGILAIATGILVRVAFQEWIAG